ncbi:MAG: SDR family oxidoreductase [Alphaproteobacteria bacterium]|nr:SDR family oxidoreductase [Alphaproteobacteria bacterium]
MTDRLKGQTVIITGGGRGYGEFMAKAVSLEGANVVLAARTVAECSKVESEIAAGGGHAIAVECDVANEAQIKTLMKKTLDAFGQIDVLINNGAHPGSVLDPASIPTAEWDATFDANVRGAYICAREALPAMLARKTGHIVNVTSSTARPGYEHVRSIPYTVSKFAVDGLTHVLAVKLKPQGVRVNAFSPGFAETRFLTNAPPGYLKGREMQTPDHVMEPIVHMLTADIGTGVIFDALGWLKSHGLYDKYRFFHD